MLVVLHIYRDIANSLLFCDLQDTVSESCKIEMSIYQPIFTHKNDIKGKMGRIYQYSTVLLGNIVLVLHINGALAILRIFCDHQETESE